MTGLLLRPQEVLERIITPESEGERCTYCRKPVVQGMFHWLEDDGQPRRASAMHGGGIESFPSWRHTDGTEGHGVRFGPDDHGRISPAERCPQCKAFDSITRRDTGYGDDCTCTACGWNKYFDRGD